MFQVPAATPLRARDLRAWLYIVSLVPLSRFLGNKNNRSAHMLLDLYV